MKRLSPTPPAPALTLPYTQRPLGKGQQLARALHWPLTGALVLALLYAVFALYRLSQSGWALGLLVVGSAGFYVYLARSTQAWRYLFPAALAMLVFIALPLLYTVQMSFTNYASAHLLSQERVRSYLLEQHDAVEEEVLAFSLHRAGADTYRLALSAQEGAPARWVSPPLTLRAPTAPVQLLPAAGMALGPALSLRERIEHRLALQQLELHLPSAAAADAAPLRYLGLREFGPLRPHYRSLPDGALLRNADGQRFEPDTESGWFRSRDGQTLQPGFTVNVGAKNYARMVLDAEFRGPFVAVFGWTVLFSALTVLFATGIGMGLAVLLNWEDLRGRGVYRTLLFLPYAVPGFISILVFKGLFNQNFGEINAILDALFGVKPAWFADPLLAKTMLLIVNVWLGYPYIMILSAGLLKSVPADLYEASALVGAGPLTNFWRITAPLIFKPLAPLLVSAFAFNFNNFVLIALLTDGRPDFLSTKIPAGQTDILVSYTYRIAFLDSNSDFGLAAAISTLIFLLVAAMSLINLRLMRKAQA
ncbi:maltose ABC transporter permease MalF [Roseateles sp. BYS180W]|uniref:Maltose/maltodextrin transport system permease protein n=1 Tax=Roseateles rivi TaxID=3299028 RepID=A0ABW7FS17_9BURK